MLKNVFDSSMPLLATIIGSIGNDFTGNEFLTWIAILAFIIFLANQLGEFWRKNLRTQPPSSDVARDLTHLEKTITVGLKRVEESFQTQVEKLEKDTCLKIEKLETNMNSRFEAAFKSRTGIHKDQDTIRERMARAETEIDNLKQKDALHQITKK